MIPTLRGLCAFALAGFAAQSWPDSSLTQYSNNASRLSFDVSDLVANLGEDDRPGANTVAQGLSANEGPTQSSDVVEGEPKRATPHASSNPQRDRTTLEEIIVTARKRAENLREIPISLTAITADDISARGLVSSADYLRGIPGVNQLGGEGEFGGQRIIIRGMETQTGGGQNFGSGSTTATYFGETSTTYSGGTLGSSVDIKLIDIERVEVLRGPQGTAFGSSSIGGAVRMIPVAPNVKELEGSITLGYSATAGFGGDNYNIQGVGNIPLIRDKLAVRATAYQYDESGYYRNVAGSDPIAQAAAVQYGAQAFAINKDDIGSYTVKGGRVAVLFEATDDLRFTLTYLRQKNESNGVPLQTNASYQQTLFHVAPEHVVRGRTEGVMDNDLELANAVVEYDLGWADLIGTYSYIDSPSVNMFGGSLFSAGDSPPAPVDAGRRMWHHENAGEIRLSTKLEGPWNVLAGVYAEKLDDKYVVDTIWYGDPATNPFYALIGDQRFNYGYLDERALKQKAAFGEVSWDLSADWTLTGGVRAYQYDRTFLIDESGPFFPEGALRQNTTDESGETFRATLRYKPTDDRMLYVGWSQGFRPGKPQAPPSSLRCDLDNDGITDGTNIPLSSIATVKPDTVDSYELGAKVAFMDRRLTIDAALFDTDWVEIPVNVLIACAENVYPRNAGAARTQGVELQTNFQVTSAFRVDLGGSWLDARLTEDAPAEGFSDGDRLPGTPKVNAHLGLEYAFNLFDRSVSVRADSVYVGRFYTQIRQSSNVEAGDYVKLDASLRFAINDLSIDVFGNNLTNEDAFTLRGLFDAGPTYGYRMRPRTIGVRMGYSF